MKKLFFFFAGLLTATFSYAQIVLSHTITLEEKTIPSYHFDSKISYISDDDIYVAFGYNSEPNYYDKVYLYDVNTGQNFLTLVAPANMYISTFAKNVFTNDDSYAMLCYSRSLANERYLYSAHFYIYDATGSTMLADLGEIYSYNRIYNPSAVQYSSGYKLCIAGYSDSSATEFVLKIYSLPGQDGNSGVNQVMQDAPRSRKYMRENQVMIEHENNTYNVEGKRM